MVYVFFQLPVLFLSIVIDLIQAYNFVRKYKPDLIISDNCFGFRSRHCETVIISHQTNLISPFRNRLIKGFSTKINQSLLKKFDEVWIPDYDNDSNNLSGKLSHSKCSLNKKFIGPLSRFTIDNSIQKSKRVLLLLSGPEPARSSFEKKLLEQINRSNFQFTLVRGSNKNLKSNQFNNLIVRNLINSKELEQLIQSHQLVVSRSGYSTIMDLEALKAKALLVPTKGQTEQEYLANKFKIERKYYSVEESDLELDKDIQIAINFNEKEIN